MNRDLVEEAVAGSAIIAHLAGKPIIATSGDKEHILSPVGVKFHPPAPTENGVELPITITQTDRHHPDQVRETIIRHLSGMDEFKGGVVKNLDPKEDFKKENTEITVRYEFPRGVDDPKRAADSVIKALSERGKKHGNVGAALASIEAEPSHDSWVNRVKTKVLSYIGM